MISTAPSRSLADLEAIVATAGDIPTHWRWPELLAVIDEVFAIKPEMLRRRLRTAPVAWARQVCMTVAWDAGLSCTSVAAFFHRDHGTVVHARKTVYHRARHGSPRERAQIKAVLQRFRAAPPMPGVRIPAAQPGAAAAPIAP